MIVGIAFCAGNCNRRYTTKVNELIIDSAELGWKRAHSGYTMEQLDDEIRKAIQ